MKNNHSDNLYQKIEKIHPKETIAYKTVNNTNFNNLITFSNHNKAAHMRSLNYIRSNSKHRRAFELAFSE